MNTGEELSAAKEFNSFRLGKIKFHCDDTVLVKGATRSQEYIAKIVRVFANADAEVFIELQWYYLPEDIPGGRKPYHGTDEIIQSNHTDVLSARVVNDLCAVLSLEEYEDMEKNKEKFIKNGIELVGNPPRFCVCKQPYNPDRLMICCDKCDKWYHTSCMRVGKKKIKERWVCSLCEKAPAGILDDSDTIKPKRPRRRRRTRGEN
eukprot:gene151-3542_t